MHLLDNKVDERLNLGQNKNYNILFLALVAFWVGENMKVEGWKESAPNCLNHE